MKKRIGWLIASGVALVLLILTRLDQRILYATKILIDNFAVGVSDFKVISFLIYFSTSCLILFFNLKIKQKSTKKILLALVLLGFILNQASYFYFTEKFGVDYSFRYDTSFNGRVSLLQPLHVHTMKGAFTFLTELLSPNLHFNYDAGLFYFKHLPLFFWVSGLVILLSLLLFSGLTLLFLNQEIKQDKTFFWVIYIIASFSMIKNIFDGGILSYEPTVWLAVFLAILFHHQDKKVFFKRALIYLAVFIPLNLMAVHLLRWEISFVIGPVITVVAFIIAFSLLFHYLTRKKYFTSINFLLIYVFFALILVTLAPDKTPLNNSYFSLTQLQTPVPSHSTVFLSVYGESSLGLPLVYQQNDFSLYQFTTKAPTDFHSLAQRYEAKLISYYPIKVHGINCDKDRKVVLSGKIKILNATPPSEIKNELLEVAFIHLGDQWYGYRLNLINDCFQSRAVFPMVLNEHGLNSFIEEFP